MLKLNVGKSKEVGGWLFATGFFGVTTVKKKIKK
jgi:hypothetical protein